LRATLKSTNNGNLSATLSELKHRGWKSPVTLASALYELQAVGAKSEATAADTDELSVLDLNPQPPVTSVKYPPPWGRPEQNPR
jgi:hypothetical protein